MIQRIVSITLLLIIISGNCVEKCVHNLNGYIKNNLRPYQVVLLRNQNNEDVMSDILKSVPYISIDVNEMSPQDLVKSTKRKSFGIPRETSLFFLVAFFQNSSKSNISSSLNYLTNLSPANVRPKTILISLTNRKSSFKAFLHKRWLNHFLDFTILEIELKNENFPSVNKAKQFKPTQTIHYYNPFTNSYVRKKCPLIKDWFPNKLLNLHGHDIRGGVLLKPPFSFPKYDEKGQLQSYSGADNEMFKCMTEVMNFTANINSNVDYGLGIIRGNNTTGMLYELSYNLINLAVTTFFNFRPSDGALYGYSAYVGLDAIVALIPNTVGNIKEDYLNLKTLYFRMLLFVGFVILMWALIGNKNQYSWKPEYIAAVLLGVTTPKQPTAICHRIIFVYFIAIGFYSSCIFLGDLTASKVINSNEIRINTFEQLARSDFIPMIDPLLYMYTQDDSQGLQMLKKKMIQSTIVDTECVWMLVKFRNVSCVIMYDYARQLEKLLRDSSGMPVTRIVEQKLFNTRRVIILERSSSYRPRFDQLVNSFFGSGLRMKWEHNISNHNFMLELFNISRRDDQTFLNMGDLGAVSKLGMVLFLAVLPGYLLSLLFFFGELLLGKFLRSVVEIFEIR